MYDNVGLHISILRHVNFTMSDTYACDRKSSQKSRLVHTGLSNRFQPVIVETSCPKCRIR